MKRFLLTLLIFVNCLTLPLFLAAQTGFDWVLPDNRIPGDRIEEAEGRGLVIRSNPVGARVFVDGIERGRTPLRLENLAPGRYFVRLERDGYLDRHFRVSVRPGSVVDVSLEMRPAVGRVLLRIQGAEGSPSEALLPLNPRISVDGNPHLSTALELPIGFRTIRVRAFGWEDISHTLYITADSLRDLELNMRPAPFTLSGASLSRQRFNPANAGSLGTTALHFDISAPGTGTLTVLNGEGEVVFSRQLDPFETWSQSVVWNGRKLFGETLPDGVYTLVVNTVSLPWDDSPPAEESFSLNVWIDSSRVIHPLSMSSGKSGLLFAPFPALLPPGSFQIEGRLLAGNPPEASRFADNGAGEPWTSLPFSAAFRFSPLERLELIAALNMIPHLEADAEAGVSGGLKWAFSRPNEGSSPLAAAAGAVFSWTGETGLTPFGMASGIELFLPFSVDFARRFSFALTPAALWTSDEGFPWEPVPRLLISGGLMTRFDYFSAGLSARSEYDFGSSAWPPFVIAGAEITFFPPPSSFVFSVKGGVWVRNGNTGGFGGLGIGMIY